MAVFVALDVEEAREALALVDTLGPRCGAYKVGLQLLTAEGPQVVRELVQRDKRVFLDLKLHEIPASVAGAVRAAGRLGAHVVTVHASAGSAVLRAAVEAAVDFDDLHILALTVITSLQEADLEEIGMVGPLEAQVTRLARLAMACGCAGVVASPREATMLRRQLPAGAWIVTPGIRVGSRGGSDQARGTTAEEAARAGATHLIVGRAIRRAADPVAAYEQAAAALPDDGTNRGQ